MSLRPKAPNKYGENPISETECQAFKNGLMRPGIQLSRQGTYLTSAMVWVWILVPKITKSKWFNNDHFTLISCFCSSEICYLQNPCWFIKWKCVLPEIFVVFSLETMSCKVVQAGGSELTIQPRLVRTYGGPGTSVSQVLRLQECATTPSLFLFF